MSQVQGFGFPKLLTKKRRVLSILFRKIRFTRTNERYKFFENGKAKERTAFAPLSQAERSKVNWDIGWCLVWMCKSWLKALKTKMPKVQTTGYASSCRRLQINRLDDSPLGGFTILSASNYKTFLVEKNGDGALNPLAVSDKRYHWKSFKFVLCILKFCNSSFILWRK